MIQLQNVRTNITATSWLTGEPRNHITKEREGKAMPPGKSSIRGINYDKKKENFQKKKKKDSI